MLSGNDFNEMFPASTTHSFLPLHWAHLSMGQTDFKDATNVAGSTALKTTAAEAKLQSVGNEVVLAREPQHQQRWNCISLREVKYLWFEFYLLHKSVLDFWSVGISVLIFCANHLEKACNQFLLDVQGRRNWVWEAREDGYKAIFSPSYSWAFPREDLKPLASHHSPDSDLSPPVFPHTSLESHPSLNNRTHLSHPQITVLQLSGEGLFLLCLYPDPLPSSSASPKAPDIR